MGYLHIDNLYKPAAQRKIMNFKRVYCMEKIHGTSAHISYKILEDGTEKMSFFSGGMKHTLFTEIFDHDALLERFRAFGVDEIVIFGEAYGGSQQRMSGTYGKEPKFIAFDVKIGRSWLDVPKAFKVVQDMGLEFVWFTESSTDIDELDKWRTQHSIQAIRNGCGEGKTSEGIVIRPLHEVMYSNGARAIAKHKNDDFQERKNQPDAAKILKNQEKLVVLAKAQEIADEWVTEMRLTHVLDKIEGELDMTRTGEVIRAMQEDVTREAEGEIVVTKDALGRIAAATAKMYKERLKMNLRG